MCKLKKIGKTEILNFQKNSIMADKAVKIVFFGHF